MKIQIRKKYKKLVEKNRRKYKKFKKILINIIKFQIL